MNIIENLLMRVVVSPAEAKIIPYLLFRHGNDKVGCVWLQFDAPNTAGKHRKAEVSDYLNLDYVTVPYNGFLCRIFLSEAIKNRLDDVKIELSVAGGLMWGWFPKDMAA